MGRTCFWTFENYFFGHDEPNANQRWNCRGWRNTPEVGCVGCLPVACLPVAACLITCCLLVCRFLRSPNNARPRGESFKSRSGELSGRALAWWFDAMTICLSNTFSTWPMELWKQIYLRLKELLQAGTTYGLSIIIWYQNKNIICFQQTPSLCDLLTTSEPKHLLRQPQKFNK